jgi:hypothetical protein
MKTCPCASVSKAPGPSLRHLSVTSRDSNKHTATTSTAIVCFAGKTSQHYTGEPQHKATSCSSTRPHHQCACQVSGYSYLTHVPQQQPQFPATAACSSPAGAGAQLPWVAEFTQSSLLQAADEAQASSKSRMAGWYRASSKGVIQCSQQCCWGSPRMQ